MTCFLATFTYDVEGTFGDIEACDDQDDALTKAIAFKDGNGHHADERGYMIIEGTVLLDDR